MKLKFKMGWQAYSKGDVIEPPAALREWLMLNGYVVPYEDDKPITERLETRTPKKKAKKRKVKRK